MEIQPTSHFDRKQIGSLHMIRGIACLLVILCHTQGTEFGQTGVDFFLVISGFVMMMSTDKVGGVEHYWIKRIRRIIPLYYSITIFTTILVLTFPFLFHSYEVSTEYFIKSLLFIPYYHNGIPGPIFELGWTLNYEMFFYLMFYCISLVSFKHRGEITCAVLVGFVFFGKFFHLPLILDYWADPIILEFCYGIIAYLFWKYYILNRDTKAESFGVSVLAYILIFFSALGMDYLMNANSSLRGITVGVIAFIVIVMFAIKDDQIHKFNWLCYIGKDSYELYLLHPFMVRGVDLILSKTFHYSILTSVINLIISVIAMELMIYVWRKFIRNNVSKVKSRK